MPFWTAATNGKVTPSKPWPSPPPSQVLSISDLAIRWGYESLDECRAVALALRLNEHLTGNPFIPLEREVAKSGYVWFHKVLSIELQWDAERIAERERERRASLRQYIHNRIPEEES